MAEVVIGQIASEDGCEFTVGIADADKTDYGDDCVLICSDTAENQTSRG